jgi:uncharacterized protein (TIGR02145 family)
LCPRISNINQQKYKTMKKITFSLIAIFIASATIFIACNKDPKTEVEPTPVSVTSVSLTKTSDTLNIGETFTLVATVLPDSATNKVITWLSRNSTVATVDSNGKVTAISAGSATIVVTTQDGNKTDSCKVTVKTPCTLPTITAHPNSATQTREQNVVFSALSVIATTTPLSYQWYSNTINSNNGGTLIVDATNRTFVPPSAVVGELYYYCVVTNSCGSVTSEVSGLHTVTIDMKMCNTNTPNFNNGQLGTPYFKTNREWQITNDSIKQVWSDVVLAPGCSKTTFQGAGGNADCRQNITTNGTRPSSTQTSDFSAYYGDFFSWCAIFRFAEQLCPAPWRVPTVQEFISLDIALGRTESFFTRLDRYFNDWGGAFVGFVHEGILNHGHDSPSSAYYWSQTEVNDNASSAHILVIGGLGFINPQGQVNKRDGSVLRCIRDN